MKNTDILQKKRWTEGENGGYEGMSSTWLINEYLQPHLVVQKDSLSFMLFENWGRWLWKLIILHNPDESVSLPDCEMDSHDSRGSKARCSEKDESRFLNTRSIIYKAEQDEDKSLDVIFITLQFIHCDLSIFDVTDLWVFLTPNKINSSGGDTLPLPISFKRLFSLFFPPSGSFVCL